MLSLRIQHRRCPDGRTVLHAMHACELSDLQQWRFGGARLPVLGRLQRHNCRVAQRALLHGRMHPGVMPCKLERDLRCQWLHVQCGLHGLRVSEHGDALLLQQLPACGMPSK